MQVTPLTPGIAGEVAGVDLARRAGHRLTIADGDMR